MKKVLAKVGEFHSSFKIGENQEPGTIHNYELRYNLMKEENDEYWEACKANNLVEIADALTDQLYILAGTIRSHGLQHLIIDCFDEVHSSNMSKLDENGKQLYREDGKFIKSHLYRKPNLRKIISKENDVN